MIETVESAKAGIITLSRHTHLNAMNLDMVRLLRAHLERFKKAEHIDYIILKSSNKKAFCAGGDMKEIYDLFQLKKREAIITFFIEEYALNRFISRYPKPIICLINGFCFGGGMGISTYTKIRIGGVNAQLAMPEVKINFFPDTGAGYRLSHLTPRGVGAYMALTGEALTTQNAHACKLLTHSVMCEHTYNLIVDKLCEGQHFHIIKKMLKPFQRPPHITNDLSHLLKHFKKGNFSEVCHSLDKCNKEICQIYYKKLKHRCSKSIDMTIETLNYGKKNTLTKTLSNDLMIAKKAIFEHNVIAGIKKVLIDKVRC